MTSSPRRFASRLGAVVLAALFSVAALAQGSWTLGSYTLLTGTPSPPLRVNLAESGGFGSYTFLSSVGGVAFTAVASPGSSFGGQAVTLRYDARARDGGRLEVIVGDTALRGDVPDWMLVPIARYAGSPYDSCVSLFGPETTDTVYDIVYHPELQNTLLGLRILQADMLLFDLSETWQLPKFAGVTVLGLGETAPTRLDAANANRIQQAMADAEFQSWVLTDRGESVIVGGESGRLRLTGLPYYYFWTSNVDAVIARQEELAERARQARQAGQVAEHNRIVEQINAMEPQVREVPALTATMKEAREALQEFNQPVYNAATTTMRYAALFRYVRQRDPEAWSAFIAQLASVQVEPHVVTPTTWVH